MAAPNIAALVNIYGNTATFLANTGTSTFLTNASGSSTVIKVNSIVAANYSSNTVNTYIDLYRGGVGYPMANTQVPPNSTLVVSGKDMMFYMVEGDSLRASANANNSLSITSSYETIS
jgi:hypothetical protein